MDMNKTTEHLINKHIYFWGSMNFSLQILTTKRNNWWPTFSKILFSSTYKIWGFHSNLINRKLQKLGLASDNNAHQAKYETPPPPLTPSYPVFKDKDFLDNPISLWLHLPNFFGLIIFFFIFNFPHVLNKFSFFLLLFCW